jgi:hypothetical protein
MGSQQLLLGLLCVIVVAIAIGVGMEMFGAHDTESNKDAITSSLRGVAADAVQYKMRPKMYGGGNPSYDGYIIPGKLQKDENGTYAINGSPTTSQIVFDGTSALNTAWVATMTVDDSGTTAVIYAGW